jgi:aminomethyltransferase
MTIFADWELPLQYTSIMEEYQAVRTAAGLFDLTHLGRIWVVGNRTLEALRHLATNEARRLGPGRSQYTLLLNEAGGIVDDAVLLCYEATRYLLLVNAGTTAKDTRWIGQQLGRFQGTRVADTSRETALLAIHGPLAGEILGRLTYVDLPALPARTFAQGKVAGFEATILRGGCSGEDGYEILTSAGSAPDLWEELMDAGERRGLKPCGLGSRDVLRLEKGCLLYGADMDESTTPLEAGLERLLRTGDDEFIGREALLREAALGSRRRLTPFRMAGEGIPRRGCPLLVNGAVAGHVTSGNYSPAAGTGIGLGYLDQPVPAPGTPIQVRIGEQDFWGRT